MLHLYFTTAHNIRRPSGVERHVESRSCPIPPPSTKKQCLSGLAEGPTHGSTATAIDVCFYTRQVRETARNRAHCTTQRLPNNHQSVPARFASNPRSVRQHTFEENGQLMSFHARTAARRSFRNRWGKSVCSSSPCHPSPSSHLRFGKRCQFEHMCLRGMMARSISIMKQ